MGRCQRRIGYFKGIYSGDDGLRVRVHPIDCGSWSCPDCGSRKARRVYARAMGGHIGKIKEDLYSYKLLTLTVPGEEYRKTHTIGQAYKQGSDALTGLIKFLKYHVGSFEYLRVCELQRDGFPHWHIILVGRNIAPKYILRLIEDYWRGARRMGFVKLNRIEGNIKRAVGYVLKYLFKTAGEEWGEQMKGARRYQASREMLGKVEGELGKVWVHMKMQFGNVGRFVGVEMGRVCAMAEDEIVDTEIPDEIPEIMKGFLGDFIGPMVRPRSVRDEA